MVEEPENHTIRLLREMREEMREMRDDLTNRIDGNTLILNLLAGLVHTHDERIEKIEGRPK